MRLTSFTDYALRILLLLVSKRDALLRISEVAQYFEISEAHLTKVVHSLGQSGWVETVRGRNGGMRLAVKPEDLSLDKLVNYLERSFELAECFASEGHCRLTGNCGLERALSSAGRAFQAELSRHTLKSLAESTVFTASPHEQPLQFVRAFPFARPSNGHQ